MLSLNTVILSDILSMLNTGKDSYLLSLTNNELSSIHKDSLRTLYLVNKEYLHHIKSTDIGIDAGNLSSLIIYLDSFLRLKEIYLRNICGLTDDNYLTVFPLLTDKRVKRLILNIKMFTNIQELIRIIETYVEYRKEFITLTFGFNINCYSPRPSYYTCGPSLFIINNYIYHNIHIYHGFEGLYSLFIRLYKNNKFGLINPTDKQVETLKPKNLLFLSTLPPGNHNNNILDYSDLSSVKKIKCLDAYQQYYIADKKDAKPLPGITILEVPIKGSIEFAKTTFPNVKNFIPYTMDYYQNEETIKRLKAENYIFKKRINGFRVSE